eukprot:6212414-Pleurochrysis_carterae.AAC.4
MQPDPQSEKSDIVGSDGTKPPDRLGLHQIRQASTQQKVNTLPPAVKITHEDICLNEGQAFNCLDARNCIRCRRIPAERVAVQTADDGTDAVLYRARYQLEEIHLGRGGGHVGVDLQMLGDPRRLELRPARAALAHARGCRMPSPRRVELRRRPVARGALGREGRRLGLANPTGASAAIRCAASWGASGASGVSSASGGTRGAKPGAANVGGRVGDAPAGKGGGGPVGALALHRVAEGEEVAREALEGLRRRRHYARRAALAAPPRHHQTARHRVVRILPPVLGVGQDLDWLRRVDVKHKRGGLPRLECGGHDGARVAAVLKVELERHLACAQKLGGSHDLLSLERRGGLAPAAAAAHDHDANRVVGAAPKGPAT